VNAIDNKMLSAYRYRIYPKQEQEMRLKRSLFLLCNLYNKLRAEKIEGYKKNRKVLTQTDLRRLALEERRNDPELKSIHSQVVQSVADRVHTAFKNFFEKRARFPRNKQPKKYRSLIYPQSGFKVNPERGLYLSKIGYVRIFVHRPILGRIKRLAIKYEAGRWYAIFIADREGPKKQEIDSSSIPESRIRGIDLGLEKFAMLDDAESIGYPEFLRASEGKIKHLQMRLSNKKKGSNRWRQLCFRLARRHLHIKRQREDFQNRLISKLYRENDVLVLEKLNVKNMLQNHSLAKSISDASFGRFIRKAIFKADMLGKHFIAVDTWGTSQFCYNCLSWVPKGLSEREHKCDKCSAVLDRDLNSAKLIKRLGILRRPPSDGGLSLAEQVPLPSLRMMASASIEAGNPRL
jgi:putative transposase